MQGISKIRKLICCFEDWLGWNLRMRVNDDGVWEGTKEEPRGWYEVWYER
jgi:hypothetical protein